MVKERVYKSRHYLPFRSRLPEIKVQAGCFGVRGSGGQKGVFSAWKYSNVYYVTVKGRLIYPIIYSAEQKYRG